MRISAILGRNEGFDETLSLLATSPNDDTLWLRGPGDPLIELLGPVGHKGAGTYDDEAMIPITSVQRKQCCDGHESFAKAHVVR